MGIKFGGCDQVLNIIYYVELSAFLQAILMLAIGTDIREAGEGRVES